MRPLPGEDTLSHQALPEPPVAANDRRRLGEVASGALERQGAGAGYALQAGHCAANNQLLGLCSSTGPFLQLSLTCGASSGSPPFPSSCTQYASTPMDFKNWRSCLRRVDL